MLAKAVPHAQKDIPLDNIESVLLTNECIVCKAYTVFESRGMSEKGVICVTNLQILFITTRQKAVSLRSSKGLGTGACIVEKIFLGIIEQLTEIKNTPNPCLSLKCKDGRICNFLVASIEDVERLYHHIYAFSFPGSNRKLFAFYNRPNKSARKVIDLYPNEQESDDEDEEEEESSSITFDLEKKKIQIVKKKKETTQQQQQQQTNADDDEEKQDTSSESDLSTGFIDETETDLDNDCEWEDDENEGDFMMYDGWDVYHPMREYLRLGVRVSGREKRKKLPRYLREQLKEDTSNLVNSPLYRSQWRLSKVNQSYELSNTYPRYITVPRLITDEQLLKSKNLRNLDRIPILSFLHPETYAAICRSSQLFVGFHGPRNAMDEYLIKCIQRGGLNPNAYVYILDCRPQNPSRGGRGCENLKYYANCEYEYLGIRSIKKLKSSIESVWELVRECQAVFAGYTRNEQTTVAIIDALRDNRTIEWITHIQKIIRASKRVLQLVQQGSSVLVHCPDGRDRTPLVVSLAMLQLDPFFRTIEGFEVLVEKEWSAAGHRFQSRCGHGVEDKFYQDQNRAPVFIIFLDCVWQLLHQHPDSFEFNDEVCFFLFFL